MSELTITHHAAVRMAQRGIPVREAELIVLIGTEVEDGYLVRAKDCQAAEKELKSLLRRIQRLKGKRLVTNDGRIITAYHSNTRQGRHLLRRAHESDLKTSWR